MRTLLVPALALLAAGCSVVLEQRMPPASTPGNPYGTTVESAVDHSMHGGGYLNRQRAAEVEADMAMAGLPWWRKTNVCHGAPQ